jgi:GGDEF domain-containing protein
VGHAFYPEEGSDAEQLLSEADRQMFQQKKRHHNRLYTKPSIELEVSPVTTIH